MSKGNRTAALMAAFGAWKDRPDFTCFQGGSEVAAIAKGVAAELGPLKDTQAKVEVGPLAAPKK
mgnify:CR=1 FL=1